MESRTISLGSGLRVASRWSVSRLSFLSLPTRVSSFFSSSIYFSLSPNRSAKERLNSVSPLDRGYYNDGARAVFQFHPAAGFEIGLAAGGRSESWTVLR